MYPRDRDDLFLNIYFSIQLNKIFDLICNVNSFLKKHFKTREIEKIKKGKFNASKKGMEVIEIVIAFGQISKGI